MSQFIQFLSKLQAASGHSGLFEAIRAGYTAIHESEGAVPGADGPDGAGLDGVEFNIEEYDYSTDDGVIDGYFIGGPFNETEEDYTFRYMYNADVKTSYHPGTRVPYGATTVEYEPEGYDREIENGTVTLDFITDGNGQEISAEELATRLGIGPGGMAALDGIASDVITRHAVDHLEEPDDDDGGPDYDGDDFDW